MNPKQPNRKKFIGPALVAGMIFSAIISVIAIVIISTNLSTPDTKSAYSSMAGASAAKSLKPVELSGEMAPPPPLEGRIMALEPDKDAFFTPFFDANEKGQTINDLGTSAIIVNFWATWCVPCVMEMPALDAMAGMLAPVGVKVLALSVDREPLEKVPAFFKKIAIKNLGINYDEKGAISKLFGVKGLPTTILIKSDGTVFGSVSGMVEWDDPEVVSYLGRVLSQTNPLKD